MCSISSAYARFHLRGVGRSFSPQLSNPSLINPKNHTHCFIGYCLLCVVIKTELPPDNGLHEAEAGAAKGEAGAFGGMGHAACSSVVVKQASQ